MKISCGQARDELALEVGQDLETGLGSELRQHLADCSECCRAWLALQESHGRLQQLKNDSPVVESPGLWTNVETVIQSRGLRPERSSFPSWLLGVAVAVLFLVVLVGEAAAVRDQVAALRERFGMTHLIVRSQIPGVDPADIEASLDRIAELG